jgi:hypothetical protein
VNIDGVIRRLKLKKRAMEEGKRDLPSTASDGLDPNELSIVAEIESIGRQHLDHYLEQQKTYAERAADTNVRALALQADAVARNAVSDFERSMNIGPGELYARKRELIQTEKALNDFKRRHRLDRPARNHASRSVKVSVLLLLLSIEAILNGYFLSKGSEFGLIGGVLEAMIIAGLNIAIGVGVGRFVAPWIVYRNWGARLASAIGLLVYLCVAFGFNLGVAHYRTAMAAEPFEASLLAYQHLMASPFGIADLESWALLGMGFLFSLFAAADGWWLDDPYPGYGSAMRHNLEAIENYNGLKRHLLDQLDSIKKPTEQMIEDITRSLASRQGEFDNIVMRSGALKSAMLAHFDHLEQAANQLLGIYRNENLKHRKSDAPARFTEGAIWRYPRPQTDFHAVSETGREDYQAALTAAFKDIPICRNRLHEKYVEAMKRYTEIDTLVANEVSDEPSVPA